MKLYGFCGLWLFFYVLIWLFFYVKLYEFVVYGLCDFRVIVQFSKFKFSIVDLSGLDDDDKWFVAGDSLILIDLGQVANFLFVIYLFFCEVSSN